MLTILVCLFLALAWATLCVSRDWTSTFSTPFFLVFLAGSLFGLVVMTHFLGRPPAEYRERVTKLVAVKDGTSSSGSFFLGSGTVDEEWVYTYYYELDDGSYKLGKEYADWTRIVEWDRSDAQLVRYSNAAPWITAWTLGNYESKEPVFFVPPNSIARDITFDLES